ncbi:MAG: NUDIX hydrolase [Methylococcales bacterium]|nr:NUDIX hydrolase [Methylococcales bacterium]
MDWPPHVTVAAVIARDNRFLLVEEHTDQGIRFNQPAGHLEPDESLLAAAKREVLEETAFHFTPEAVLAVQLWRKALDAPTFLRLCFTGAATDFESERMLDDGIIAAHWLSAETILAEGFPVRSPLVQEAIRLYQSGSRYPLSLVQSFLS